MERRGLNALSNKTLLNKIFEFLSFEDICGNFLKVRNSTYTEMSLKYLHSQIENNK